MQIRAMGPGAGWRWLMQGINLGRHNPKAIFGAAALLIVVALVPTLVQLIAQFGLKMTSTTAMLGLIAFSMLYSVLVMPPVLGGLLRVIDASENGREAHAAELFDTFKSGQGATRMIALAVLLTVIAVAVFAVILAVFGPGIFSWYMQMMAAAQAGAGQVPPSALTTLPEGFGMVLILFVVFGLFFQGAYAIAFCQVVLTDRSIGGAVSDGFAGALKNLLPLLVLLVASIVLGIALMLVVGLLVMLLSVVGGLVHPVLGLALAAPVYLAFLLIVYVVMFGVMYHIWHDVAGSDASAGSNENNIVAA